MSDIPTADHAHDHPIDDLKLGHAATNVRVVWPRFDKILKLLGKAPQPRCSICGTPCSKCAKRRKKK